MVGAWCFGSCQAHWCLPVGFLLFQYSVLCTVEPLSLLYLLFISWFILSRRWCLDKLEVFNANHYVSWFTSELRVRLVHRETGLSTPVKYFYWPFQGGTSFVDHLCSSCFCVCSLLPCGHLKGMGWPHGSWLWCLMWFCYFPIWYPGTGVVLDCIDSWLILAVFLTSSVVQCTCIYFVTLLKQT